MPNLHGGPHEFRVESRVAPDESRCYPGIDAARILAAMSSGPDAGRGPFGNVPPVFPGCRGRAPRAARDGYGVRATGRTGEGVSGSNAGLPRLFRGVHLLGRRAGLFREQRAAERPAALPRLSGCGKASSHGRGAARVSCRGMRRVWRSGDRSVRPAQRPSRLLQLVLRQGPRRDAGEPGHRLRSAP
jgi:hypothetical protein